MNKRRQRSKESILAHALSNRGRGRSAGDSLEEKTEGGKDTLWEMVAFDRGRLNAGQKGKVGKDQRSNRRPGNRSELSNKNRM